MNPRDYLGYAKWVAQVGLSNPILFIRDLNRLYHRRLLFRSHAPGVDVFSEDWDTLVLLDACRYDMFSDLNTISGTLTSRQSRGSHTVEFLYANLSDRDLRDTVYITANPQLSRHRTNLNVDIHAVVNVWRENAWDKDAGTVPPEKMTNWALKTAERYPQKRLVVHYIQPHYPFITAETDFDTGDLEEGAMADFWTRILIEDLDASKKHIWNLYQDNLRVTLPHVQRLVDELDGKTIVTSDHGNMVGERASPIPIQEWGHPIGLYTDELITVPWLECEFTERRTITMEDSENKDASNQMGENKVKDRLSNLGYIE